MIPYITKYMPLIAKTCARYLIRPSSKMFFLVQKVVDTCTYVEKDDSFKYTQFSVKEVDIATYYQHITSLALNQNGNSVLSYYD